MRSDIPTYCGIYLLKQSTAEKSYKIKYALKVGYGKNIASRLEKYRTHNAFFDLIATKQVPEARVQSVENYYKKQLAKIGKLVPGTKEWFYVSQENYNYISKKGFRGLEVMEIRLNRPVYGTNDIAEICKCVFKGPNSDWDTLPKHTINSRMNQAIFGDSHRSNTLRKLADQVRERQGLNSIGTTKGCKFQFTPQEVEIILQDKTFNPTGLDKQVLQVKYVYTTDSAIANQPKAEKKVDKTISITPFNNLKYNEDISLKQNRANRKQIEQYLKELNELLEEYKQENI